MIPEIGHFALILALALAACQAVLPLVGAHRNDAAMMSVARPAAFGQFLFVTHPGPPVAQYDHDQRDRKTAPDVCAVVAVVY